MEGERWEDGMACQKREHQRSGRGIPNTLAVDGSGNKLKGKEVRGRKGWLWTKAMHFGILYRVRLRERCKVCNRSFPSCFNVSHHASGLVWVSIG